MKTSKPLYNLTQNWSTFLIAIHWLCVCVGLVREEGDLYPGNLHYHLNLLCTECPPRSLFPGSILMVGCATLNLWYQPKKRFHLVVHHLATTENKCPFYMIAWSLWNYILWVSGIFLVWGHRSFLWLYSLSWVIINWMLRSISKIHFMYNWFQSCDIFFLPWNPCQSYQLLW